MAERPVLVDVRASRTVTVLLSRDCANVMCPPAEDPEAVACRGGTCVDPACTADEPSACGDTVACDADEECGSASRCATARCVEGVCLWALVETECPGDAWCSPQQGCLPRRSTLDAGTPVATCDDGLSNGDETGVDCGGSCDPCLPSSCRHALEADAEAPSGPLLIDPDGATGPLEPFETACDQETDGGGWTRVFLDDFDFPRPEWSEVRLTDCDRWGTVMGLFARRELSLLATARGVAHAELRITARYLVVDSRDGEAGFVEVDGRRIWSRSCGATTCGQESDECGSWAGPDNLDALLALDARTDHVGDDLEVVFGAELNSAVGDEAWGLDDVAIWVR